MRAPEKISGLAFMASVRQCNSSNQWEAGSSLEKQVRRVVASSMIVESRRFRENFSDVCLQKEQVPV